MSDSKPICLIVGAGTGLGGSLADVFARAGFCVLMASAWRQLL
jgi:NAD(P)-dependent dehydrogenase (short-subunit alcohol dehydrogenase family)